MAKPDYVPDTIQFKENPDLELMIQLIADISTQLKKNATKTDRELIGLLTKNSKKDQTSIEDMSRVLSNNLKNIDTLLKDGKAVSQSQIREAKKLTKLLNQKITEPVAHPEQGERSKEATVYFTKLLNKYKTAEKGYLARPYKSFSEATATREGRFDKDLKTQGIDFDKFKIIPISEQYIASEVKSQSESGGVKGLNKPTENIAAETSSEKGGIYNLIDAFKNMVEEYLNNLNNLFVTFADRFEMSLNLQDQIAGDMYYVAKKSDRGSTGTSGQTHVDSSKMMSNMTGAFKDVPILGGIIGGLGKFSKFKKGIDDSGIGGAKGMALKVLGGIGMGVGALLKQLKKSSPILQAVGDLFNLAMTLFFMPFGNMLGEYLLPFIIKLVDLAVRFNEWMSDFSWSKLGDLIKSVFSDFGSWIADKIMGFFQPALDGISVLAEAFNTVKEWISSKLSPIITTISDRITAFINDPKAFLIEQATQMWDKIKALPGLIWEYMKQIPSMIASVISGGVSGVWDSITGLFHAEGGLVPGTPGGVPGIIGEAGPELIIPLDELSSITGGGGVTIMFSGTVYGMDDFEAKVTQISQKLSNKATYR